MNKFHNLYTNAMGIRAVVSKNIEALRESTGLSAKAFGAKLGVTGKHIYDIEDGTRGPSLELLEKISEVYLVAKSSLLEPGGVEKAPQAKPEPMSSLARRLTMIPDEVWEKAQELGDPNDEGWQGVVGALEEAIEAKKVAKNQA